MDGSAFLKDAPSKYAPMAQRRGWPGCRASPSPKASVECRPSAAMITRA
jgi:hypothetical protein